jgi:hypothetical protein
MMQFLLLFFLFAEKHGHIDFKGIIRCIFSSFAAGILMFAVTAAVMKALPGADSFSDILHIVLGGGIGLTAYFVFLRIFGGNELGKITKWKTS